MKKPNITFKSLLDGIKNIDKRNEYFNYLSDEGKRLEIAWDFLKLLTKRIITANIPFSCEYWSKGLHDIKETNSKKFQHKLCNIKNIQDCEVCARGGMMLSQIRLGNSLNSEDKDISDGNINNIKGFYIHNFSTMEKDYEQNQFNTPYDRRTTEKLMNMCCNILVNGNFNPDDKTDYLID